ncbi:hypothetical protein [Streptomyces sp. NPDC001389]
MRLGRQLTPVQDNPSLLRGRVVAQGPVPAAQGAERAEPVSA